MSGVRARSRAHPARSQYAATDGPDEELFDWQKLRRFGAFSLRSIRRQALLFVSVSAGLTLLAALVVSALPKTYEVEARLLAQRNAVLSVRSDQDQMEPTRAAVESILRRDNLLALVQQTDLLQEWTKRRAPLLRAKDRILSALHLVPADKELADRLADALEEKLTVWTTPAGLLTIRLRWSDPVMAYRLVDAAQQNFLERRHLLEVATIVEQISILEEHAVKLRNDIDAQVADLQRLREQSAPKGARAGPAPAPVRLLDPQAVSRRVQLQSKRRAIADLEEFYRRHQVELQTRLLEQRAIYSESHPMLLDLQRSIESYRRDSPQLVALRQEEAELRRRFSPPDDSADPLPGAPNVPPELFRDPSGVEDVSLEYARAQLRYAVQQYSGMRERIDAARIDLDTARAAFKYRYAVVAPAQVPRGPIQPRVPLVMGAAVVLGLLLGGFSAAFADMRGGLVLERWQVEDLLPARTVVDLRLPSAAGGQLPPWPSRRS
jgi:uncharacterized protein involved in exopolysaccharide biosynthesis